MKIPRIITRTFFPYYGLNISDAQKRSILHAAAFQGEATIAEVLINHGATINANKHWLSPLHIACSVNAKVQSLNVLRICSHGDLQDVAEVLLRNQANALARDRHWQTPLHVAAGANAVDCVRVLKGHVRDANVTDRLGRTALHYVAVGGYVDIAEELLSDMDCDVNVRDKKECRYDMLVVSTIVI